MRWLCIENQMPYVISTQWVLKPRERLWKSHYVRKKQSRYNYRIAYYDLTIQLQVHKVLCKHLCIYIFVEPRKKDRNYWKHSHNPIAKRMLRWGVQFVYKRKPGLCLKPVERIKIQESGFLDHVDFNFWVVCFTAVQISLSIKLMRKI